jgi:hypothetical protein
MAMNFPLHFTWLITVTSNRELNFRTNFDNCLLQTCTRTELNWTAFSLSYKPWSLTCGRTQRFVLLHVSLQRSRDPSLLLRNSAFTVSPRNTWCGMKWWEGKTSVTTVAQSCFEVSAFQQLPHGAIMPQ